MTGNDTTGIARFRFRPQYWRDNFKVEADLHDDDVMKFIERVLYRRPYVVAVVSDENKAQFVLYLGSNL